MRKRLIEVMDLLGHSERMVIGTVALLRTEEMAREMMIYLRDHRDATEQEIIEKVEQIREKKSEKESKR